MHPTWSHIDDPASKYSQHRTFLPILVSHINQHHGFGSHGPGSVVQFDAGRHKPHGQSSARAVLEPGLSLSMAANKPRAPSTAIFRNALCSIFSARNVTIFSLDMSPSQIYVFLRLPIQYDTLPRYDYHSKVIKTAIDETAPRM